MGRMLKPAFMFPVVLGPGRVPRRPCTGGMPQKESLLPVEY